MEKGKMAKRVKLPRFSILKVVLATGFTISAGICSSKSLVFGIDYRQYSEVEYYYVRVDSSQNTLNAARFHKMDFHFGLKHEIGSLPFLSWGLDYNLGPSFETMGNKFGLSGEVGVYGSPWFDIGGSKRVGLIVNPILGLIIPLHQNEISNDQFGGSQYKVFKIGVGLGYGLEYQINRWIFQIGGVFKDDNYLRAGFGVDI